MQTLRRSDFPIYIVIAIAGIGMIIVGQVIGRVGLSFQLLIILGMSITILVTVTTAKGVKRGFLIWIMMFGLGYRTIHVTNVLLIHPLILQILLLAFIVLVRNYRTNQDKSPKTSHAIGWVIFLVIWVWGWLNGIAHGILWDSVLQVAHIVILVIPIWFVMRAVLLSKDNWTIVSIIFYTTGTIVSLLGALEYLIPSFQNFVPISGYVLNTNFIVDSGADHFLRAVFVFWGASLAAFMSALSVPFAIVLWNMAINTFTKALIAVCVLINLFGIYICGYRSLWAISLFAGIFVLVHFGRKGVIIGIILSLIILIILPQTAQDRFISLVDALQGNVIDSSSEKRVTRIDMAIQLSIENPLGLGWGSGGWVHNDFIQVFVELGIIPGLLYIFWYLITLTKGIFSLQRNRDPLLFSIVTSFIVGGGFILTQGPYQLAQLMVPVWFVWGLLNIRIEQLSKSQQLKMVIP